MAFPGEYENRLRRRTQRMRDVAIPGAGVLALGAVLTLSAIFLPRLLDDNEIAEPEVKLRVGLHQPLASSTSRKEPTSQKGDAPIIRREELLQADCEVILPPRSPKVTDMAIILGDEIKHGQIKDDPDNKRAYISETLGVKHLGSDPTYSATCTTTFETGQQYSDTKPIHIGSDKQPLN